MKDYFTLAEVAKILKPKGDDPEEEVLKLIFEHQLNPDGHRRLLPSHQFDHPSPEDDIIPLPPTEHHHHKLEPSYYIKRPLSVDIDIWVEAKDKYGTYCEPRVVGTNVPFTGFVSISGAVRHSGGTGEIQLWEKRYKNEKSVGDKPLKLFHWNEEQKREETLYPKRSFIIPENDLIVHWEHLRKYIYDNQGALDRFEEMRASLIDITPNDEETPESLDLKADAEQQEQPTKNQRQPQLDHKNKPRDVGKLFKDALQVYYEEMGKECEKLDDLIDMIKKHHKENQEKPAYLKDHVLKHSYLKNFADTGNNDDDYLKMKTKKRSKWFSKAIAQRNFREQTRKRKSQEQTLKAD
ncbi:MAG: hypothetical protein RBQ99_07580 [Trichlorobacter sp.]|nr:hypothetical protein [Trichlorobacter sp.]